MELNPGTLDALIAGLLKVDCLQRLQSLAHARAFEPPHLHTFSFVQRDDGLVAIPKHVEEAVAFASTAELPAAVTYSASRTGAHVEYVRMARYSTTSSKTDWYVHVPPWVRVHRAPFHTFGPNLFGLAYTATGDVHIRDDLQESDFAEVLQHEVFHQLYPNCSEQQVRQFTVSKFGDDARIHRWIGPG